MLGFWTWQRGAEGHQAAGHQVAGHSKLRCCCWLQHGGPAYNPLPNAPMTCFHIYLARSEMAEIPALFYSDKPQYNPFLVT